MPPKASTVHQWPADNIERRAVKSLVPYARNARLHNAGQVKKIAASITEWGWTNPVLIDEDGSIIAGHGRVLAAQRLGLAEVPVMVASGWSDEQKRAYCLADNRLAEESEFDPVALRDELMNLANFDLSVIGFDPDEINTIINGSEKLRQQVDKLQPIKWARVLISFPVDHAAAVQAHIQALTTLPFVEIDYGGN